jgi:hypothetical protein
MQRTQATIADVIPSLILLISNWKSMQLDGSASLLRDYLVAHFENKFKFELKSDVYMVASIFDTSNLHYWSLTPSGQEYVIKGNKAYMKSNSNLLIFTFFKIFVEIVC